MTVSRGPAATENWSTDVTVGAVGPKGDKGDTGERGAPGNNGSPGAAGTTGATGPRGPSGMTWRGEWKPDASYALTDAVSFGGSSYVSVAADNSGNQPDGSPTLWNVFAEMGTPGTPGTEGTAGAPEAPGGQGPAGPTGPAGIVPGATALAASIYQAPANTCGVEQGALTTTASCNYSPQCVTAFASYAPPNSNCNSGDTSTLVNSYTNSSNTCEYGYQYQCNPYSCNPYSCGCHTETYSCNCGFFGCSTCSQTVCDQTCYQTCYNTCFQCQQYYPQTTGCYACSTPFTLLGKLVK